MAIRQAAEKVYGPFSEGLDTSTAVGTAAIEGTLSKALNTDLLSNVLASKRLGYIALNSAWGTRRIRAGILYKKTDGNIEDLIYGEEATTNGSTGIFAKRVGSTITTIKSDLRDGVKPSIIQIRNLVFVFTGYESFIYDGTTTYQIGITAPVSAPVPSDDATGSLNTGGNYITVYSYYNSSTGAESNPSDSSDSISITDGGYTFTCAAGDSTTADKLRVYRSVDGGSVFLYDHDEDIAATSYTLDIADTDLGTELEADNNRLPEEPTFGIVQDNRIFVGGFKSNQNRIMYSKIGSRGPMPQSFQAADFVDCNINDGDKLVGLGIATDMVIALKEESVGHLLRIQALTGNIERGGSTKYLYEDISNNVTGISHHTMIQVDSMCIWLGRADIYSTDGIQIQRYGIRIVNDIRKINFAQSWKFSALNKTDTLQIMFSVCRTDESEPDFQIVGHYRGLPKIPWTFYGPGTNTTTHPGLQTASMWESSSNREKIFCFGSSAANGLTYQFDTGGNDNTKGIYWDNRLPWETGRNMAARKKFHSYYLFVLSKTASATIKHIWEENEQDLLVKSKTDTMLNTDPRWNTDSLKWNEFNWGNSTYYPLRFHPQRTAYSGRYGWQNTAADQSLAVKGLTGIIKAVPTHR